MPPYLKPTPLILALGALLMLPGCLNPATPSNNEALRLTGYFPAAKDAAWVYARTQEYNGSTQFADFTMFKVESMAHTAGTTGVFFDLLPHKPGHLYHHSETQILMEGERIPLPLKVGNTWEYKDGDTPVHVEVMEEAEVEVPAGKFKALHLIHRKNSKTIKALWLTEGVGMVKRVDDEMGTRMTYDLHSYRI